MEPLTILMTISGTYIWGNQDGRNQAVQEYLNNEIQVDTVSIEPKTGKIIEIEIKPKN